MLWEGCGSNGDALSALVVCDIARRGERFVEPGRFFVARPRFVDGAELPDDVVRDQPAERAALLHVVRMLLRRCPARVSAQQCCVGWVRIRIQALSHIAILALLGHFICRFPRVKLEADFDSEGTIEDPGAFERQTVLRALKERGIQV